jgi:hypothetical protein
MQTMQGTSAPGRSTRPDDVSPDELRRARGYRRIGIGALALFVLAGLLNLLGVRAGTVSAAGGGYHLSVEYEEVTRPGLASDWIVEVRREGGFDGPVTLFTDATYFDRFDFNQLYPEPASISPRGEDVLYVFEQIEGEVLRVAFDGRASPTFVFALARGSTGLEVDGREIARVEYTTVVMP